MVYSVKPFWIFIVPLTSDIIFCSRTRFQVSSGSSRSPTRRKTHSSAARKVEVNFAWRIDMLVADISFTLKKSGSDLWKEIVVFGMKRLPGEKVRVLICLLSFSLPCFRSLGL